MTVLSFIETFATSRTQLHLGSEASNNFVCKISILLITNRNVEKNKVLQSS